MELLDKLARTQAEITALMAEAEAEGYELQAQLDPGATPPWCQLSLVRRFFPPIPTPDAANA